MSNISYEEQLYKNWVLLDEKKIIWDREFRDLTFIKQTMTWCDYLPEIVKPYYAKIYAKHAQRISVVNENPETQYVDEPVISSTPEQMEACASICKKIRKLIKEKIIDAIPDPTFRMS